MIYIDVPRGEEFLPGYTREDLTQLYRKEKDSKAKVRLLAAIYRKEGLTYWEIGVKRELKNMLKKDLTSSF